MEKKSLLLVDDEMLIAMNSAKVIQSFGYDVVMANSGSKAVDIALSNDKISLVLMDIDLGKGIDGPQAARLILEKRNIPIVFLTSHSEKEYVDRVKEITRYGYVIKNSGDFVLRSSIDMAFELFEANKKLHDSEESLAITFLSIGDAVIATDINGLITRMNSKAEQLTGWRFNLAIGRSLEEVFKIFNASDRSIQINPVKTVLDCKDNVALANNTVLISKDGKEYQIADSAAPIRDNNGIIRGVILVFSDYTEKYRVLEELRESEERYRAAFNTSPDSIIISTLKGLWIDVNDSFTRITGFTRDEVVGKLSEVLPIWDNLEERKVWVKELQEKGSCINFRAVMRAKDHSPIIVLLSSRIITINQVPHIFSIAKDITQLEKAEQARKESEERYRAAFITSPDAFIISTIDGLLIDINESFSKLTGYQKEEIVGKLASETNIWANPEDREKWIKELLSAGVCEKYPTSMFGKDNKLLNIVLSSRIIRINQVEHILTIAQDITELVRTEQILRDSEERYRAAFFTSPDAISITTLDGKWIDVNNNFSKLTGFTRDDIFGKKSLDISIWVETDDREKWIKILLEKGECDDFEAQMKRKDNIINTVLLSSRLISINNEMHIFTVAKDITELKKKDQDLRESEEKYRAAFQTSPDAINITTMQGVWIDINEGFTKITGFTRGDVIGKNSTEIDIWTNPQDRQTLVKGLQKNGVYENLETVLRCKDGSLITVLMSARIIMINQQSLILSITRDITQRKHAELALKESEEWHKAILQTAMDGYWLVDMQGRLLEVNETYSRMCGYSVQELLTMQVSELDAVESSSDVISRIQKMIALGENRFETRHRRKDGSVFDVEVSIQYRPVAGGCIVAFLRNITERKLIEQSLATSLHEKETLLHEVHLRLRNFLYQVSNLLNAQYDGFKNRQDILTALENGKKRINSIALVHGLLYESDDYSHINMEVFIQKLAPQILHSIDCGKKISIDIAVKNIFLNIDNAVSCGLLITELMTNACKHAFPDRDTGNISIILKPVSENLLELVVADNGIGFNKNESDDKGLGMMLIQSHIAQLHAGLEYSYNDGTVCRIVFPANHALEPGI
ncbi:MAG TPA: PAS domain S-box protein [bacterium]|nr:PAS domain S-box protein [bacterium]